MLVLCYNILKLRTKHTLIFLIVKGNVDMYKRGHNLSDYYVLATDAESGASIVSNRTDDDHLLTVWTHGKEYNMFDFRPIYEQGRRLREKTITNLRALKPEAEAKLDEILANNTTTVVESKHSDLDESAIRADERSKVIAEMKSESGNGNDAIKKHIFEVNGKVTYESEEVFHRDFDAIVASIMINEPVYLFGPAGTGKSYIAEQVAKALGLEFYATASVTDDIQIKGFIDAMGNYHSTEFYKAFTEGGLFLLDELDASDESVLVMLNNAIANGYFEFPMGRIKAHEDFRIMATGNTNGMGADENYTGRSVIDASSMDRFGFVAVDYDSRIELQMAKGDAELVEFADEFRKIANQNGINILLTYRAIKRIAKLITVIPIIDALKLSLIKGYDVTDVYAVVQQMYGMTDNKYRTALYNYCKAEVAKA